MRITIPYVKILSIQNMRNINGKIIGVSLGVDKGFANINWFINENNFPWANQLKKGDAIQVPIGDLCVNEYENNQGIVFKNIMIKTSYVELVERAKEKKEQPEKETKTKEDSIEKDVNDALVAIDEIDWNNETKEEQINFSDDFKDLETKPEPKTSEITDEDFDEMLENINRMKRGD